MSPEGFPIRDQIIASINSIEDTLNRWDNLLEKDRINLARINISTFDNIQKTIQEIAAKKLVNIGFINDSNNRLSKLKDDFFIRILTSIDPLIESGDLKKMKTIDELALNTLFSSGSPLPPELQRPLSIIERRLHEAIENLELAQAQPGGGAPAEAVEGERSAVVETHPSLLEPDKKAALTRAIQAAAALPMAARNGRALFKPFNQLPVPGINIYLGNDQLREALSPGGKTLRDVNSAFKAAHAEQVGMGIWGKKDAPNSLKKLPDLMISFQAKEDTIGPIDKIKAPGVKHLTFPIPEMTKADYENVLENPDLKPNLNEIFLEIDQALNEEKSVYFHCNQGQHRSAAMLILYLHLRTGLPFEDAYKFVFNARPDLKPLESDLKGRDTMMTVARAHAQKIGPSKPDSYQNEQKE